MKIVISPRRNTVFYQIDAVATDQAIMKTWPKFWLRRDGRFDKKLHKFTVETVWFVWHDFWRILAWKWCDFGVHLRPHYLDSPRRRDFLDPGVSQDQLRSVPERPRVAQTGQNVSQNSPQMAQERPKVCQVQAQHDVEASNRPIMKHKQVSVTCENETHVSSISSFSFLWPPCMRNVREWIRICLRRRDLGIWKINFG